MRIYKLSLAELFFLLLENSCLKRINYHNFDFSQLNVDSESFVKHINQNLLPDWKLANEISGFQTPYRVNPTIKDIFPRTVLVIAKHYNTEQQDSVVDAYQIFIWVEGKGIGATEIFKAEIHYPSSLDNHALELNFNPNITAITEDFMVMEILVNPSRADQFWQSREELLFGWWRKK